MLRNYLKSAWRHLWREKGYAAINILGLALGLACFLLVGLYVEQEFSYDAFHEKGDRVYRVNDKVSFPGREAEWRPSANALLAPALRKEMASVETAVRMRGLRKRNVSFENSHLQDLEGLTTEPEFFEVFSFEMVEGNPETALERPYTVVLTETLAKRIFGDELALGQHINTTFSGEVQSFEVTGVVQDPPSKSHLSFDLLLSYESVVQSERSGIDHIWHYTYVVLSEDADPKNVESRLPKFYDSRNIGYDWVKDVRLEPLSEIYFSELRAPNQGSKQGLHTLGAIALAVLLIACANYVNLATARATRRQREVGVRKTAGANRLQLAGQFLSESLLLCLLALPLALLFLQGAIPLFNQIVGTELSVTALGQGTNLLALFGVLVGIGLLAGSYPAFYLSRFDAASVLRGRGTSGQGGVWPRKGLVVLQFAAAVALIACTATMWQQLRYVQTEDLGFEEEHVLFVSLPTPELRRQHEILEERFREHSGVTHTAATSTRPFGSKVRRSISHPTLPDSTLPLAELTIDSDFIETMGMRLKRGDSFFRKWQENGGEGVLLNETATRALRLEEPVGEKLDLPRREGQQVKEVKTPIIGVVEDFHFESRHETTDPYLIRLREGPAFNSIVARLDGSDISAALAHMRETWAELASNHPFDYRFLDDQIAAEYEKERRTASVITALGGLAILLACLGLFGLAAYAAERRRKEVAIRKVLGATVHSVVTLISKDFLKLVAVASVLAAPVAYYGMSRWLQDFAYRIHLRPWIFFGAGLIALLIALLTVSTQALRAAWTDPATAIRQE